MVIDKAAANENKQYRNLSDTACFAIYIFNKCIKNVYSTFMEICGIINLSNYSGALLIW